MINQWMEKPCNRTQYATTDVIYMPHEIFYDVLSFVHLFKMIARFVVACVHYDKKLSFAIKIVIVYFQISSSVYKKIEKKNVIKVSQKNF
jgi:hypothetical protein